MRALMRFLKSEGWLAETLTGFALTISLIAMHKPDGGMTGKIFGQLVRRLGFNPHDHDTLLWLALLGNLIIFAAVFYTYRAEIEPMARKIASALQQMPEVARYHFINSLLVTSALAAVFTAVAATGGTVGEWISVIAVALSGNDAFYLLRVPICFCVAYPFLQCAVAANRVAKLFGNHHQNFPGGDI